MRGHPARRRQQQVQRRRDLPRLPLRGPGRGAAQAGALGTGAAAGRPRGAGAGSGGRVGCRQVPERASTAGQSKREPQSFQPPLLAHYSATAALYCQPMRPVFGWSCEIKGMDSSAVEGGVEHVPHRAAVSCVKANDNHFRPEVHEFDSRFL